MKAKTIRKAIRSKIDDWLDSIDDPRVRQIASKNSIVTGGCIASMLLKEQVNDFDIYLRSREACVAVAEYYIGKFTTRSATGIPVNIKIDTRQQDRVAIVVQSSGIASEEGTEIPYQYFEGRPDHEADQYVSAIMDDTSEIEETYEETERAALESDDKKYRPVFLSTNAITLSKKVQIITRFYGEPSEIHANYDFVHCTNYWKSWDDELVLHKDALESLLSRELRYVGSKYPLCSLIRIRKFVARGWTINAGQMLKMCMQLNELDLKDHTVLRDQLTGVDAAYFFQLMDKLKERDSAQVDTAYLVEIIDRIF